MLHPAGPRGMPTPHVECGAGPQVIAFLREIGDCFEGPPPWGTGDRGPRDHIEGRKPLVNRDVVHICDRCRAGIPQVLARGFGPCMCTCPMCGYQGRCPKQDCGGEIESGQCVVCHWRPHLYHLVDTIAPPEFAEHGAMLAANLLEGEQDLPGSLTLFAHGNLVAIRYADEKLDEFLMRNGKPLDQGNVDDHLSESTDEEVGLLQEAARMFAAGLVLIQRATGITLSEIVNCMETPKPNLIASERWTGLLQRATVAADVKVLKAAGQLVVDACWGHERCCAANGKWTAGCLVELAVQVLAKRHAAAAEGGITFTDGYMVTFQMLQYVCERVSPTRCPPGLSQDILLASQQRARDLLDYLLGRFDWKAVTTRPGHALERLRYRQLHARCLLLRSHDKLTRLGDIPGAYEDLDCAIAAQHSSQRHRYSLHALRAPHRLSSGQFAQARADLQVAVAAASPDAPNLHENLWKSSPQNGNLVINSGVRCSGLPRGAN